MGREIRRVPPNWEHPKKEEPNWRTGSFEERYKPLYDRDFEAAMADWLKDLNSWIESAFARVLKEHPDYGYRESEPYRSFCEYGGGAPEPDYYRPSWTEAEATAYQMYETVSEGTPVSPVFNTKAELIDYLVENGDFWDQERTAEGHQPSSGWDRAAAESFVGAEWAPSLVVMNSAAGVQIKEPRDGAL